MARSSPAEQSGLKTGDFILKIEDKKDNAIINIEKTSQIQTFISQHKGNELTLTIQRGSDVFQKELTPRVSPPAGQGAMGVELVRTVLIPYPWYEAPARGIEETFKSTIQTIKGWAEAITSVSRGVPSGVQFVGVVGIIDLFNQFVKLGPAYFLLFLGKISIYLALFNILPIPAADGGKMVFLAIEAIRKKPVPDKIEENITAVFFFLLVGLMIFVTIKDVIRIF